MMKIEIKGLDAAYKALANAQKQARYAAMRALNDTAFAIKKAEEAEIDRVFDKPTPFTRRAVAVRKATKLDLTAEVFLRPAQARYLREHIEGGPRRQKPSERRLSQDAKAPSGYWVPGPGVRLNAYGNLSLAQIKAITAKLNKAGRYAGSVFYGRPGPDLPTGIWARKGRHGKGGIVPLLLQVSQPRYRKRFHFYGVGKRVAGAEFGRLFNQALAEALRTAR